MISIFSTFYSESFTFYSAEIEEINSLTWRIEASLDNHLWVLFIIGLIYVIRTLYRYGSKD